VQIVLKLKFYTLSQFLRGFISKMSNSLNRSETLDLKVARLEVRFEGISNDVASIKNDIKTSSIMLKEAITDLSDHINGTLERHENEIQEMKRFRSSIEVMFTTWGKVALLGIPIVMTFLSLLMQKVINTFFK